MTTAGVTSVSLNPTSVVGGNPSTGTVTLTGPAPTGGTSVALLSDNASATVPSSVTVAAGATTATFTVTTTAVGVDGTANVSATANGTASAALTLKAPTVTGLAFSPSSVIGGNLSTGTVTLSSPAPTGGFIVSLTSGNTAAGTVPATVTVVGGATTATFSFTSIPVQTATPVTVTATANSVSVTGTVTVTAPTLSLFTIAPANTVGGQNATGTITLTGAAPAGGYVITVASDNAAATPATTVTIPANATSGTFTIPTHAVSVRTVVNITVSVNGTTIKTAFAVTL